MEAPPPVLAAKRSVDERTVAVKITSSTEPPTRLLLAHAFGQAPQELSLTDQE